MENEFDNLCDKLRFNIYTQTPEPEIIPFLKENFPYFINRPTSSNWTVYPPRPIELPKLVTRSFKFKNHPFFKVENIEGRVDFLTQIWLEGPPGIQQIRVIINFSNKIQAENTLSFLIEESQKMGAFIRRLSTENQIAVTFSQDSGFDELNSFTALLKKDLNKCYTLLILFWDDKGEKWHEDSA